MILQEDNLYTMDPTIRQEWTSRLRDPEAKQGKYRLELDDGSQCCLGVLMRCAVDQDVIDAPVFLDDLVDKDFKRSAAYVQEMGKYATQLSPKVIAWSGLVRDPANRVTASGIMPFLDRNGSQIYLDGLNDTGMPFAQIADLIDYFYS